MHIVIPPDSGEKRRGGVPGHVANGRPVCWIARDDAAREDVVDGKIACAGARVDVLLPCAV